MAQRFYEFTGHGISAPTSRSGDGVTQSATDLAAIGPLADAVDALGRVLSGALDHGPARDAIVTVRAQVQEYTAPYDQYWDLGDL